MFVIISYDIENDKLRAKIAKILEGHGERVQYSVFECHLSEKQLQALEKRIRAFLPRVPEDTLFTVRFYRLCMACEQRITIVGSGGRTTDESFYIA